MEQRAIQRQRRHHGKEPAPRPDARDEATLRNTMRDAIDQGQFRVYYQPIVGFDRAEVIGIEALLRWEHPQFGVLTPAQFLHLAEDTGLIVPIGTAVLHAACRQAAQWAREATDCPALTVSVNLSARQVSASDLLGTVTQAVAVSGLEPRLLVLEVSEATLLDHAARCAPALHELAMLGVQLSVDDFGARHTSLRMLRDLPVSSVKIDRSFVTGLGTDVDNSRLVAAVVAYAHAFGAEVTAQGIDTSRQLSEVRSLGCDRGQGFYFAYPQPGEIVQALVHHRLRYRERHSAA
jgi:EAL domain-containing protein (putative c-di-GMP-specific phosphodiesterase class I)